jgi:serine/threonine-protein kinase SRPK3
MVFEMLGANLLSLIKAYNYQGIPIPIVKRIAKQVRRTGSHCGALDA